MPMEQSSLKDADICILNSLTESCAANPDAMVREFCSHLGNFWSSFFTLLCLMDMITLRILSLIGVTLKNGGNVLVPCFPSVSILFLIDQF